MDPLKDATPQQLGVVMKMRKAGCELHSTDVTPGGNIAMDITTPWGEGKCIIISRGGEVLNPAVKDLRKDR